jgi:hypothetical protein
MRHIWSLLAGIVIAPLGWLAVAYGQAVMFDAAQAGSSIVIRGLVCLLAVGLVCGVIGSLRVSPMGPLAVATGYLGATAAVVFAPVAATRALPAPRALLGEVVDPSSPLTTGVPGLVGMMLLVAAGSPQRWRRWPQPAPAESDWSQALAPELAHRRADRPFGTDSFDGFAPTRTPAASTDVDAPSWSSQALV